MIEVELYPAYFIHEYTARARRLFGLKKFNVLRFPSFFEALYPSQPVREGW
ncbi:hypothetical protein RSAG8_04836, partial [Rhizoctonia solani AG-8 WAC10335]